MSTATLSDQLEHAAAVVRERLEDAEPPGTAIVLGTGLGMLAEAIEVDVELPYADIPGFPVSTAESHAGRLVLGRLDGRPVIGLDGRFHRYEGYTLARIGFPVRVLAKLGVDVLVVTGAVGGMNPLWSTGELMLITDHINLMGDNPLIGPNLDAQGPRFPDMSEAYDAGLRELAARVALDQGITLRQGVYVAVTGPCLETAAEYRMLRALGADVVGMSTVPEVIVANHAGMRVLGVATITDACLPDALEPVDVAEIIATAQAAEPTLTALLRGVIQNI